MARPLTQEKNASGVRTSYGHMVGYTWTFGNFHSPSPFACFSLSSAKNSLRYG